MRATSMLSTTLGRVTRCWILMVCFLRQPVKSDNLPTCLPKDFHYEYTECDSDGGRWRVSVPKPDSCIGGAPNPPVRGKGCDFTCGPGEYLDIDLDQECHKCPSGHYSLGGGVRYDDWDQIPSGFSIQLESFNSQMLNPFFSGDVLPSGKINNCSGVGWSPRSKYLASDVVNCTAILVYTANLVKPGLVSFSYQYEDDNSLFTFEVQNSRCETLTDRLKSRYLTRTSEGLWGAVKFELKTGVNVLFWRVLAPAVSSSRLRKPVLIQNIDISGVAYTSQCASCNPGTYSEEGAELCIDCPSDTYSEKGASQCIKCNTSTEYSEAGSASCKLKAACTENDYYEYQTACDETNKTKKIYKWIEPKRCRDDLPEATMLPIDGDVELCPPCNPGMEPTVNGSCQFCPAYHYSDGNSQCTQCPGSTAPETRIVYKWWNNLPHNSGISSSCLSESGQSCLTKTGWNPARDHIYSSKGQADDAFLLLNLHVNGFQGKGEYAEGRPVSVGKVSFTFETACSVECSFLFMQRTAKDGMLVLESWSGSQEKSRYTYEVTNTAPATFVWAFQKRSSEGDNVAGGHVLHDDVARIYVVEVTNTRSGGAGTCKVCPKGASQDGCIPCPEGQYVDVGSSQCRPCPADQIVRSSNAWGVESCSRCGPGLVPRHGSHCVTSCRFNSSYYAGHEYNFFPLAGVQTVEGIRLFTTSGYKYYRMFQVSLCASGDVDAKFPLATCSSNASLDMQTEDVSGIVRSPICRSTILPATGEDGQQLPVSVQPLSLSDVLVSVTDRGEDYNITLWKQKAGFLNIAKDAKPDVHFVYVSDQFTNACRHGRMTIVTMRCDTQQPGNGSIELPAHCPDGTCDGCVYLLLWRSQYACRQCRKEDYIELAEECREGKQKVIRIKPKDCYSDNDADSDFVRVDSCSVLWQSSWPIWLKVIVILVPVILCLGITLLIVVLHCWLKNKKLQYKYMKLIESTTGKDGELPAAETCALDEGEEDDQFDVAVEFKQKGRKLFGKLKNTSKKDKRYEEFHDVSTDHSSLLG